MVPEAVNFPQNVAVAQQIARRPTFIEQNQRHRSKRAGTPGLAPAYAPTVRIVTVIE